MLTPDLDSGSSSYVPCGRDYLLMFLVAVAARLALALAFALPHHVSVWQHAHFGDGVSYMRYAKAILGDTREMREYDRRVFPGYPLLIAPIYAAGVPIEAAALGLSWIASGFAAVLAALLCRDRRIGWAMVWLIPHYLLYTSMAMNEPVLLSLILAGIIIALRHPNRPGSICFAGLLLGFAGLVRPVACFAVAGLIVQAMLDRRRRDAALIAIMSAGVVLAGVLATRHWMGDALKSYHVYRDNPGAYNGELLTWPFKSLVMVPLRFPVAPWKQCYIWAHVALVFTATVILVRRMLLLKPRGTLDTVFATWIVGNTAFIICVGGIWGHLAFHRFVTWAQPPLLWALRPVLPRRQWVWIVVAALSFAIALASIARN